MSTTLLFSMMMSIVFIVGGIILFRLVVLGTSNKTKTGTGTRTGTGTGAATRPIVYSEYANVISEDQYYRIAGTKNVPALFSYQSFLGALNDFKDLNLSKDLNVAKREIACLLSHISHEVAFQYTEQLCSDHNSNCRAKQGDKSVGFGRGVVQLTYEGNYAEYSKYVYGDTRLVQDPDAILRNPNLFWGSGLWFYRTKLQSYMQQTPSNFKMTTYTLCCYCVLHGNDGQTRGDTYKKFCSILGTDPGPDDRIYAQKGVPLNDGACY